MKKVYSYEVSLDFGTPQSEYFSHLIETARKEISHEAVAIAIAHEADKIIRDVAKDLRNAIDKKLEQIGCNAGPVESYPRSYIVDDVVTLKKPRYKFMLNWDDGHSSSVWVEAKSAEKIDGCIYRSYTGDFIVSAFDKKFTKENDRIDELILEQYDNLIIKMLKKRMKNE